jgi:heme exporter protein A
MVRVKSLATIEPAGNTNPPAIQAGAVQTLAAEGLACRRGTHIVVSGLSFEVRAGTALILRGPNGSGKTTLLRTVAGFLPPAAGSIQIRCGFTAERSSAEGVFHYIGHNNGVKPRLSVIENIGFWQRYYTGDADVEAAEAALEAFGLLGLASFSAGHLSQGQARRLGLARLLAAQRPVWLLDEPSVSLDDASARLLEHAIARHLAAGGLAIASTHLDLAIPEAAVLELGRAPLLQ